jgi:hypothetical protein
MHSTPVYSEALRFSRCLNKSNLYAIWKNNFKTIALILSEKLLCPVAGAAAWRKLVQRSRKFKQTEVLGLGSDLSFICPGR